MTKNLCSTNGRRLRMLHARGRNRSVLVLLVLVLLPLQELHARQQEKIAALKQSLGENQARLRQYQWTEATAVSVKGEVKSQTQKICRYGPDGKVQKQQISASPQQATPGGLKGRVIAKKKEEMTDYMEAAVALIHQYVPPDSQRIQAAQGSGNLAVKPMGSAVQLEIRNYLKPGDTLAITMAGNAIGQIHVGTYLDSQKDTVTLDVSFASLNDGTSHPDKIVMVAPAKEIQVVVQNTGYQKVVAQIQQAPQQSQSAQSTQTGQDPSPQDIDKLTAPIALYPDALIAQILTASTNYFECASFASWLGQNTSLQASALQEAAQKAGFDACFVALAPFPQVVQMMAQQKDWTSHLGQAFTSNRNAVFDSIQRLRAQAQAAGNLKSSPQQQVQTQTTSSGQQVIVIQPANPQVVYVPTYNPQTVYVQSTTYTSSATAAAVGFTAGVIIGAAASTNYYYGPYAWHGAAMYNEAWDNRYDYAENRNEMYQQNASQRQSAAQSNQTQRQSASQSNQAQRQSAASSAQGSAQTNQAARQSAAGMQGNAQANQAARQSSASTYSRGSGDAAAQRSGMSSGGFSGFQGGGQARAESARGSGSLGGGFGGGGGRSGGRGGRR